MDDNLDAPDINSDVEPTEEASIFNQKEGVDWHLAHLIYEADMFGLEPGLTLSVGGMLVSGTLISGRKYFELLEETYAAVAERLENSNQKENVLSIGRRYGRFKEVYTFAEDQPIDAHRPHFIHLRDAKFYLQSGNPVPDGDGTLWRGKLTSIDGVTHGTLEV